jgi:hypothetical protein
MDYSKDGKVDASDSSAVLNGPFTLHYIASPTGPFAPDSGGGDSAAATVAVAALVPAATSADVGSAGVNSAVALGLNLPSNLTNATPTLASTPQQRWTPVHATILNALESLEQRSDAPSRQLLHTIDQLAEHFDLSDDALDGLLSELGLG